MKRGFIIGIVWAAVIIGVISFGATVFFLENNNKDKKIIDNSYDNSDKQTAYITDESSVRTNNLASLSNSEISKISIDNEKKKINIDYEESIENNVEIVNENIENSNDESVIINSELDDSIESINKNVNSLIRPIKGEIINLLSTDELTYSKTLQEWTVHNGIDFEAQLGDEVYSIKSGKIKEIAFDYIYGDYIIIEHDNGYESLYANITTLNALKVGDTVKQGQIIGYVAESFGFEAAEETHLHFELKKDGEYLSI